jgi:HemY protein
VLGTKLKQGHLPKDVHRRRDAILALQEAKAGDRGRLAHRGARGGNSSQQAIAGPHTGGRPGRPQLHFGRESRRYALRILKKGVGGPTSPRSRSGVRRHRARRDPTGKVEEVRPAVSPLRPDHEESKLLRAELNIAAEDFPGARQGFGRPAGNPPDDSRPDDHGRHRAGRRQR